MFIQIFITAILILLTHLFYTHVYRTKTLINYYRAHFQKQGFKVLAQPYRFLYSSALGMFNREGQIHGNEYTMQPNMQQADIAIGSFANRPYLQIYNITCMKEYFGKNQNCYEKCKLRIRNLCRVIGGLLFAEEKVWQKKRRVISHIFNFNYLKQMVPDIILSAQKTIAETLEKAEPAAREKVNMLGFFKKFTSSIIVRLFFGERQNTNRIEGHHPQQYLGILMKQANNQTFQTLGLILGESFLKLGLRKGDRQLNRMLAKFKEFADSIIKERVQQLNRDNHKYSERRNHTGGLLEELYYAKKRQTQEQQDYGAGTDQRAELYDYPEIIDEFCTFFFAGTSTAQYHLIDINFQGQPYFRAHVLTMCIVFISKHPEILAKARDQINRVIKTQSDLTRQNLDKLQYLTCVINESARMYGPVPGLILREVVKQHTLAGVKIMPGTLVSVQFVPNRYNPMYFNEPHIFRPQRWLEDCKNNPDSEYAVLSFSAGRHNCIGQHLAMIEIKIMLTIFLVNYDFMVLEEVNTRNLQFRSSGRFNAKITKRVLTNEQSLI